MAFIQSTAILTRIREVLEDGAGTLRVITAGAFAGDLPMGLSYDAERMRSITGARIDSEVTDMRINPASPGVVGNLALYDIDVKIRVIRPILPVEQIDDDSMLALKALALEDGDKIAQALGCGLNLIATEAGAATQLLSGQLRYVSTTLVVIGTINEGTQTLETQHLFTGVARAAPAT